MKINESKKQCKLENLKIGECFKDEYGEIYIKSDCQDDNNGVLCVSLECGEVTYYDKEEKVEHLPNACINTEG